jgi:predicted Fe-Mo cluster-binding NifX family protein
MNICIPVNQDQGLESPVCAHFGSAPLFMIINTENGDCRAIPNRNHEHNHGMCQPLLSLAGENVEGMVVGGIGMGALGKLQAANVSVYRSEFPTVAATLAAFKSGTLRLVTPQSACQHHGHEPHDHSGNPSGTCNGHS